MLALQLFASGCAEPGSTGEPTFREGALGLERDPVAAEDEDLALQITPSESMAPMLSNFRAAPVDSEASILSYQWDFGDGSTSTQAEPEHTYEQPGSYEVTLTAELDLSHIAIGLTDVVEARQTVHATTTEWSASMLDLDLGQGWGVDSALGCSGAVDCDPTTIRLPGAPDGVYMVSARLFHSPEDSEQPQPRFVVDGIEYDFVPPAGSDSEYLYIDIKTIVVNNHEAQMQWDDVDGGGIILSHIVIAPDDDHVNPDVTISASADMGERPLTVDFELDSNVEIESYTWTFGDGTEADLANPSHTYEETGRMEVALRFVDASGVEGIATTHVTVKPSKVDLVGLTDLRHVGFWGAGFQSGEPEFNARRREELEALNLDYLGPYSIEGSTYGSSEAAAANIHAYLETLAMHGLYVGARMVERHQWYTNDENEQPASEWIFDPSEAIAILEATDRDGDGISDLEGAVAWVYLGHEMGEYASRDDRAMMIELIGQYFPNTPIYPYLSGVSLLYERSGWPHPAGGVYDDYQLGQADSDVVGLGIGGPFVNNASGERIFDPGRTLRRLREEADYVAIEKPDSRLWVNVTLPGEDPRDTEQDMWSAEEILDYARVLLNEGGVETLLFRAYGRWRFDLGFGMNTADPTQEESGFIEQREAIRWIGSWVKQTRAGLPILIIRQPEMQQTRPGPTVDVLYGVIGEQTDLVADVVLQLDDRDPVHDPDLDGTLPIEDVDVGTHTLVGYLADESGR